MFCPSCGESVPDESRFCQHCGTRVSEAIPRPPATDAPAVAVTIEEFDLRGPTEVKRTGSLIGGFTNWIGRGFQFDLSLLDSSNNYTTSDGQLIAALRREDWLAERSGRFGLLPDPKEAHKIGRDKYTVWHGIFGVAARDFMWRNYAFGGKQTQSLTLRCVHAEPLVYVQDDTNVYLHVWFVTPEAKCLYKVGTWSLTWRP